MNRRIFTIIRILIGAFVDKTLNSRVSFLEYKKQRHLTIGENARLHPESEIYNLQTPDKLVIGKDTHIRGELCVYPYGGGYFYR